MSALRVGLALFVLAWLFGPFALRSAVPIWLPFVIALALELHFFLGGIRPSAHAHPAERSPEVVDPARYGASEETDDLLLIRRGDEELWIPYSGETGAELEALIADAREEADREALAPGLSVPARRSRRSVRPFLVGLCVVGVLAAVAWFVDSRRGWDGLDAGTRGDAVARFSAEASQIVGRPVTIRCDESGEYVGAVQHADGVAVVGGRLAYLAPERCHDLYRLAFEDEVTFSRTARALAVLAHEAWHLRGVRDEGTTECYALQSGVDLGQRLGLSEETARQMMRQQLAENALRTGASLDYVVPSECHDGGRLDLEPYASEFP